MTRIMTDAQRAFGTRSIEPKYKRKITPLQRDEIRRRKADGENPRDLALEYGITAGYVREL